MTREIKTVDITANSVMSLRSVQNTQSICASDINQINGKYLVVENENNRLIIYPQSPQLEIENPIVLDTFGEAGLLENPLDAKWDYIRQKLWIADTGRHRILKSSSNEVNNVEVIVEDLIYYPYAIALNLNIGGCFVKGYDNLNRTTGSIIGISSSGEQLTKFIFSNESGQDSSSSSESGVDLSSSSESGGVPETPSYQKIDYDYVRDRIWWSNLGNVYMADQRNRQVKSFYLGHPYANVFSVSIEQSTGNAFVLVKDVHNEDFVIQVFRDNNEILAVSWIEE